MNSDEELEVEITRRPGVDIVDVVKALEVERGRLDGVAAAAQEARRKESEAADKARFDAAVEAAVAARQNPPK